MQTIERKTVKGHVLLSEILLMCSLEAALLGLLFFINLFSQPILLGIAAVMLAVDVIVVLCYATRNRRLSFLKYLIAFTLCIAMMIGCLSAGFICAVTGSTLQSIFGSESPDWEQSAKNIIFPATRPFAVYLSGSDSRTDTLEEGEGDLNSDVNIIALINPATDQILLINTPRDYYIPNPAADGAMDLLTHCGNYGIDNSRQALSDLYGLPIAYTAQINFTGFESLIDALGGITIYSDVSFYTWEDGYLIEEGENHLDGQVALAYARERAAFASGDNARGENQMKVITALVKQLSPETVVTGFPRILRSLEGTFETNMPISSVIGFGVTQLTDLPKWEVFSYAVTGTSGRGYNYSGGGVAFAMHPHYETVAYASELINRVMAGDYLTEADFE